MEYVRRVQRDALYDAGLDAAWGQQLPALSTCDRRDSNARIMVIAWSMEGKMSKKVRESLYEPEEAFRHMWETGMDELPRNRGRSACRAAEMMLKKHCQSLDNRELRMMLEDLEVRTVYHACYLELLYAEQEAAENEFLCRLGRRTE